MNILYLGPKREEFINKLKLFGDNFVVLDNKLSTDFVISNKFDLVISYGYRYIISEEIINIMKNKIINLHISYLPWNRGADPNFWSFLENTKKGVSIHLIDEGIDTGDILIQKEVTFTDNDTLRTSYNKLSIAIEALFIEHWSKIRLGKYIPIKQNLNEGSIHFSKDKQLYTYLLTDGWDTPIIKIKK
ncbi:formyltransferase family protein [Lysinibacillus sp. LZ02]|uniref:formyltransferase family protein n=1 Tax=Lysinibacillus sp. LZ02 TaxID=3420668 RepID=UPI003D366E2C